MLLCACPRWLESNLRGLVFKKGHIDCIARCCCYLCKATFVVGLISPGENSSSLKHEKQQIYTGFTSYSYEQYFFQCLSTKVLPLSIIRTFSSVSLTIALIMCAYVTVTCAGYAIISCDVKGHTANYRPCSVIVVSLYYT